jgi:hypothetical protein
MLLEKYLTIVGVLAARYVIIAGGYYVATWVALKNRRDWISSSTPQSHLPRANRIRVEVCPS